MKVMIAGVTITSWRLGVAGQYWYGTASVSERSLSPMTVAGATAHLRSMLETINASMTDQIIRLTGLPQSRALTSHAHSNAILTFRLTGLLALLAVAVLGTGVIRRVAQMLGRLRDGVRARGNDEMRQPGEALRRSEERLRQADRALRSSEELFLKAFHAIQGATSIMRVRDQCYLDVNERWLAIHQCRREEVIGRTTAEVNIWRNPEDRTGLIRKLQAGEVVRDVEINFTLRTGEPAVALVSGELVEVGGEPCVFWTTRDITEKKKTETELRASEQRWRLWFEQTPLGSQIFAPDGRVLQVNAEWKRLFRMSDAATDGYNVLHDPQLARHGFREWIRVAFDGLPIRVPAFPYRAGPGADPDGGDIRWLTARMFPLLDGQGLVLEVGCVYEDITERRHAEEEVRQLNAELERRVADRTTELEDANRELEAFSYSVSHDLRAPLRHIASFADLLQGEETTTLSEQGNYYLAIIRESAQRMGNLIDDLFRFSRLGRAELRLAPASLSTLVREAQNELQPTSQGWEVEWKIDELPTVRGDASLLRQVFVNLLSNALKYSRTRSPVRIEIGVAEGQSSGDEVVIFVRDNGVGFDMQYAHKLFGAFQRLHSARDFEGTGIGLANVRRIVQRHGGRTWAEGRVNAGATFYFSLPQGEKQEVKSQK